MRGLRVLCVLLLIYTAAPAQAWNLVFVDDSMGRLIPVSNFTREELDGVFEFLKNLPQVPHKIVENGCESRVLEMCYELELLGMKCAKLFASGPITVDTEYSPTLKVDWLYYHVAVMLYMDGNPVILDPSLFNRWVYRETWEERLTHNPETKIQYWGVSNAYHWNPSSLEQLRKKFDSEELVQARAVNAKGMKAQMAREPYYPSYGNPEFLLQLNSSEYR